MKETCVTCSATKAPHLCKKCEGAVCKNCVQVVDADRLSFYQGPIAEEYVGNYCMACFDSGVSEVVAKYDDLMERAKDVTVYFIEQGKETRLIKRQEKKIKIEDCADKSETLLRLAFRAVEAGFNGLVDVQLTYEKHREGSFKISNWKGSATPVQLDDRNRPRDSKLKSPSR